MKHFTSRVMVLAIALGLLSTGGRLICDEKGSASKQVEQPTAEVSSEKEAFARVSGVVVGPGGEPMSGAKTWLRHGRPPEDQLVSVIADGKGQFTFDEVLPGSIYLVALAEGHSYGGLRYTVQPGQIANNLRVELTLPSQLVLRIEAEDGKPVAGAELEGLSWKTPEASRVWLPLEIPRREGVPVPVSDEAGLLRISRLPEDVECSGRIRHPDFARRPFEKLVPGDQPVEIVLDRGYPITVIALDGRTGKPAAGATVRISGMPHTINLYDEPVDEEGRLIVRLGEAKHVSIHVRHPDLMWSKWYSIHVWGDVPSDLTVEAKLLPKATVTGRVIDEQTGEPVAGAVVGLNASGRHIIGQRLTDESGRFELVGPEGWAALQVMDGGGYWAPRGQRVQVDLDASRRTEAPDLKARRLPTIRGNVVMPDGKPAAHAFVQLVGLRSTPVLTGPDGGFELAMQSRDFGATVEAQHLTERLSGGADLSFEEAESGKHCRVELLPESELRGTVVGADGKPQANVRVWLRSMGTVVARCLTDENGRYRFVGLGRHASHGVGLGDDPWDRDAPSSGSIQPTETVVLVDPLKLPPEAEAFYGEREAEESEAAQLAPELRCQAWVNSPPLALESLRGKWVLLDFWATWCGPCVAELPQVQLAHELFADRGVVVIGIHHNSVPLEEVREFAEERNLTFPTGLDTPTGETCGRYNVTGWPTKILIDPNGRIVEEAMQTGRGMLGKLRELALYADAQNESP